MRTILVLAIALAALALPLAAADHGKLPHVDTNEVDVGPCYAGWSLYWPGNNLWAGCVVADKHVGVACGTGALGWSCSVRPLLP